MVSHRKFGCKLNWHKACHESVSLLDIGEFADDKKEGVYVGLVNSCILNEGRNGEGVKDPR